MRKLALSDEILMQIEKPARYIGNELNSVVKDDTSQIRFAMCFPDVYELVCHILEFRSYTTCLTAERTPGVNVSIPHGRICIKL